MATDDMTKSGMAPLRNQADEADEQRDEAFSYRAEARKIRSEQQAEQVTEDEDEHHIQEKARHYSSSSSLASSGTAASISEMLPNSQPMSATPSSFSTRRPQQDTPTPLAAATINLQRSNLQELRAQVAKLEQTNRSLILLSTQADSEKQLLKYQLDLLKDQLDDAVEQRKAEHSQFLLLRQEGAYQRMQVKALSGQVQYLGQQVRTRDDLLISHGLAAVDVPSEESKDDIEDGLPRPNKVKTPLSNGGGSFDTPSLPSPAFQSLVLSQAVCQRFAKLCRQSHWLPQAYVTPSSPLSLNSALSVLLDKYESLVESRDQLEAQVVDLRQRVEMSARLNNIQVSTLTPGGTGTDYDSAITDNFASLPSRNSAQYAEALKSTRAQVQEYKVKLLQAEQNITSLQSDLIRLESQVKRYKTVAESSEQQEEEAKAEKRKLQRELRNSQNVIEDLKSENKVLQRKLEKFTKQGTPKPSESVK